MQRRKDLRPQQYSTWFMCSGRLSARLASLDATSPGAHPWLTPGQQSHGSPILPQVLDISFCQLFVLAMPTTQSAKRLMAALEVGNSHFLPLLETAIEDVHLLFLLCVLAMQTLTLSKILQST